MSMAFQDKVIVLKKIRFSESDLIFYALNRKGERLNFIAHSALKSKKRFGGGLLEPTHYIKISYKPSKKEGLHTLSEAELINDFAELRKDYARIELALYFVDIVAKTAKEGDLGNQSIFNLLGNALKYAQTSEHLRALRLQFDLKFLHYQGVLPLEYEFKTPLGLKLESHGELETLEESERQRLRVRTNVLMAKLLN